MERGRISGAIRDRPGVAHAASQSPPRYGTAQCLSKAPQQAGRRGRCSSLPRRLLGSSGGLSLPEVFEEL
eukprot:8957938-Alexandrium_andersonii.AAC.1